MNATATRALPARTHARGAWARCGAVIEIDTQNAEGDAEEQCPDDQSAGRKEDGDEGALQEPEGGGDAQRHHRQISEEEGGRHAAGRWAEG